MTCGFILASGIIGSFEMGLPSLGPYLDGQLKKSPHLCGKSLERRCIRDVIQGEFDKGKNIRYGTIIAFPWQDKAELNETIFIQGSDTFETNIEICYFNIPLLHEFSTEGNAFFDQLANTD